MKPFSGLQYAPAAKPISTARALTAGTQALVTRIRTSLASARTAYKSLLRAEPSAEASATTAAEKYQCSAALGSLANEQAWKKEIQSDMRACIAAELVLRRVESSGAGGDGGAEKAPLKWRVEGLEERVAKGAGRWIVPVVGDA
jgi:signal transduction protein with GAF and PtsI domain